MMCYDLCFMGDGDTTCAWRWTLRASEFPVCVWALASAGAVPQRVERCLEGAIPFR